MDDYLEDEDVVHVYAAQAQTDMPTIGIKAGDILSVAIIRDPNPAHPPHEDEPILFDLHRSTGIGDRATIDWHGGYSYVDGWIEIPIACRIFGGYKMVRLADELPIVKRGPVFGGTAYVDPYELPKGVNVTRYVREQLELYEAFVNGNNYGYSVFRHCKYGLELVEAEYGFYGTPETVEQCVANYLDLLRV